MTHRILSRWLVGIAATVLSGLILYPLLWIGQTLWNPSESRVFARPS